MNAEVLVIVGMIMSISVILWLIGQPKFWLVVAAIGRWTGFIGAIICLLSINLIGAGLCVLLYMFADAIWDEAAANA